MYKIFFFTKKFIFPLLTGLILLSFITTVASYFYLKSNTAFVKDLIEKEMEERLNYDVEIATVQAQWHFTNPSIVVNGFKVFNKSYEKSVAADRMEFDFSWLSLIKLSPVLDRVQLDRPIMNIVRDSNGIITINGIALPTGGRNVNLANWLLDQDDVLIKDGQISWQDLTRSDAVIQLSNLNFNYGSSKLLSFIGRREFTVNTMVKPGSDEPLNLSGYVDIKSIEDVEDLQGYVDVVLNNFDLAKFRPWLQYPVDILSGKGSLNANIYLNDAKVVSMDGRINFKDITIQSNKIKTNKINSLNSYFNVNYTDISSDIKMNNFILDAEGGLNLDAQTLNMSFNSSDELTAIKFAINKVDLDSMSQLASFLPEDFNDLKNQGTRLAPTGIITDVMLDWQLGDKFFQGLDLRLTAEKIGFKPINDYPGIKNLSAVFDISDNEGLIKISSSDLTLTNNDIFRQPIKFKQINGELSWLDNIYQLNNFKIINKDFVSDIVATYISSERNDGNIDLEINIPSADISQLTNFYPKFIGKTGLQWLDTSLLKGIANNTKISLKGDLHNFPFVDDVGNKEATQGLFEVTSSIKGSTIEYGAGWPNAEDFDIDVSVVGSKIEFTSNQGHILNNDITSFTAVIDDFTKDNASLDVTLFTVSPLDKMINAINNSPVKKTMKGVSEAMLGSGPGQLELTLNIPLKDSDSMRYMGSYLFDGASMQNSTIDLPLLSDIRGRLMFNEDGISLQKGNAMFIDRPLALSLNNDDSKTVMNFSGLIDAKSLGTAIGDEWLENFDGEAEWKGKFTLTDKTSNLILTSDLKGLSIEFLQDFNKKKETPIPFKLIKQTSGSAEDQIDISYGDLINAQFFRDSNNSINRGFIGINTLPKMPDEGIILSANLNQFDSESLNFLFEKNNREDDAGNISGNFPIKQALLNVDELMIKGNKLTKAFIDFIPNDNGANITIDSEEVEGEIKWFQSENLYQLKFKKMHLVRNDKKSGAAETYTEENITTDEESKQNHSMSSINMEVDSFRINESDYGEVKLTAHEDFEGFVFDSINIDHDSYLLKGSGYWKSETFPEKTSMRFEWDIKNVGTTLDNLGYPNLIEDGYASVIGLITWDDGPANFNAEDFYGNFTINTKKGVIKKIEPGVAGRLVGLISLQNLPRRLTLDFRDLFQEGLPYKKVQSPKIIINKGVLSTEELNIKSPSANIKMQGKIDFVDETQDLFVIIEPKVSDTITAGALVGGPLAAAAAFIAQKILDDPFNKITTAEYHITGSWDDPQDKIVDTNVDNFIEDSIINPASNMLDGVGGAINKFIIQPADELNN